MKTRARPLPTPAEGAPYIRVAVAGRGEFILRTPSLHRVARLVRAAKVRSVAAAMAALSTGGGLLASLRVAQEGGAELLELLGALVGISWADPVSELETPIPTEFTEAAVLAYGAAVYDELDRDGWTFEHIVVCALAIGEQVAARSALTTEALDRASFFAGKTAPTTAPSSKSSASSSTDDASTA